MARDRVIVVAGSDLEKQWEELNAHMPRIEILAGGRQIRTNCHQRSCRIDATMGVTPMRTTRYPSAATPRSRKTALVRVMVRSS